MTNIEKFKTAQERADAFLRYCEGKGCDECELDEKRILTSSCNDHVCLAFWLDLEYEEEKPLPCYECSKATTVISRNGTPIGVAWRIECNQCAHTSGWYKTKHDAIAAHNRVAKAVKESEANDEAN